MRSESQNETILKMLRDKKQVTPLTAFREANTLRLSGRIKELRDAGHQIKTTMITVGDARVASYSLEA